MVAWPPEEASLPNLTVKAASFYVTTLAEFDEVLSGCVLLLRASPSEVSGAWCSGKLNRKGR